MPDNIETTAEASTLKKFNLGKLPPPGSEWAGKFFNKLWEDARKEKIGRLGLHQRWLDLHAAYRGKKRRRSYPRIGANHLFKNIESYVATLTEKVPIADITADDADNPMIVKAVDLEAQEWWNDTEQQNSLSASVKNMQINGTTIEKGVYDAEKDDPAIIIRDPFNFFPAPGYRMCDLDIPYVCDVDFMEEWEIKAKFELDDKVTIPSDADEQIAGTSRETTRGGKLDSDTSGNLPSNYAPIQEQTVSDAVRNKTMVVEIWVRDKGIIQEPVIEQRPIIGDDGRPSSAYEEVDTGQIMERPAYVDGIRKVVICPALMTSHEIKGVLDDSQNPNINWNLLEMRIEQLMEPQPVIDERTGQPMVNQGTGEVLTQPGMEEAEATQAIYARAKTCFPLWGKFPYSATPSRVDTTQWWGFSTLEQLEELQGKAELMLTKYLLALERQMFPIFMNVQGSGVEDSEITNEPGIVINPTIQAAALMGYIDTPSPPSEYLEALHFLLWEMDVVSMSPEVTEGRRPKGISAAAAIIALQDKAATLFNPQIQQTDSLISNRGRMWLHFKMNFDTTAKQVKVDDQFINFKAIDVFSNFKFNVESGSSAPITKAGRRQQFVELRKIGDMDRLSLLEFLDIPNAKLINERLVEQESVPGAIKLLIQAGLPEEIGMQVYQMVMGDQFAVKPQGGTTMPTVEDKATKAGGYSEGINAARQGMSDLREG